MIRLDPKPTSASSVWSRLWKDAGGSDREHELLRRERSSPRWTRLRALLIRQFGRVEGLRCVELGSGRGDMSVLLAEAGAYVTLVDQCFEALAQARARFESLGLSASFVECDIFNLPSELVSRFDLSVSLGVVEHFKAEERTRIIAAHRQSIHDDGLTLISVPHARCVPYRIWKAYLQLRRWWPYGREIPYSKRELARRVCEAGFYPREMFAFGFRDSIREHWGRSLFRRAWNRPAGPSPLDSWMGMNLVVIAQAHSRRDAQSTAP